MYQEASNKKVEKTDPPKVGILFSKYNFEIKKKKKLPKISKIPKNASNKKV